MARLDGGAAPANAKRGSAPSPKGTALRNRASDCTQLEGPGELGLPSPTTVVRARSQGQQSTDTGTRVNQSARGSRVQESGERCGAGAGFVRAVHGLGCGGRWAGGGLRVVVRRLDRYGVVGAHASTVARCAPSAAPGGSGRADGAWCGAFGRVSRLATPRHAPSELPAQGPPLNLGDLDPPEIPLDREGNDPVHRPCVVRHDVHVPQVQEVEWH